MDKVYLVTFNSELVYISDTLKGAYNYLDNKISKSDFRNDIEDYIEDILILNNITKQDWDWRDYAYHSQLIQVTEYKINTEY